VERYFITIDPLSYFGTPLKGDTLFGQVCWQVAYASELVQGGLEHVLEAYPEEPFAIFSSAFPVFQKEDGTYNWLVPRPSIPENRLFETDAGNRQQAYETRKEKKEKKWLLLKEGTELHLPGATLLSDREAIRLVFPSLDKSLDNFRIITQNVQSHNTINRISNTTGTGMFSPYVIEQMFYALGLKLGFTVLVSTEFTDIERMTKAIQKIGSAGFGRDATIGAGRFRVENVRDIPISSASPINALYTTAPCVPECSSWEKVYFTPFTRFGRHGDSAAVSGNPFKAPVIMADEGAVLFGTITDPSKISYVGKAVTGISSEIPATVAQGYAPVIPVMVEA
jgi:CRISPR-associated protein Csm4